MEQKSKISLPLVTPYLALLLVQLIFGFNYSVSKVILEQLPPLLWAGVRVLIAALVMFSVAFIFVPKEQRRMDRDFLKKTFGYGLIGIGIGQAFFLIGLKYTTTQNSAILNTLTPIFTLFFAILMGKEKLTGARAIGFLMALVGVLVLRRVEDFSFSTGTLKGDGFTLLNSASLALFFAMSRTFLQANSAFWATAWMFLFSSVCLLLAAIPDFIIMQNHSIEWNARLWSAMIYSVLGATLITYFLNSWTLKKVNASTVAVFFYLQPIIAVFHAWFSDNEPPTFRMIIAILCIFSGLCFGVLRAAPKKVTVES